MKKKVLLFAIFMLTVLYVPSVFAVNITGCEAVLTDVVVDVKIANTVHTIILVIQIAVPVLLVVFGMLDLFKGITAQKEDEIKKGQQMFIKRLISAAIIFFVVAIVKLLVSFVADENGEGILECANCFINGASETTGVCK